MSNVVEMKPRYIDFPETFKVGDRIHCCLHGGKDGTIVAIHGKQDPQSIKRMGGGIMVSGGNATLDIAWDTCGDRGGFSERTPESIARGVQWKMLSGYRDPDSAIAEAQAFVAAEKAKKDAAQKAFEAQMEEIKKEYDFLTVDDGSDRNIIQKNLRTLLKKRFPGVKFRVTKDSYDSRSVSWVDGPVASEVKKVTGIFEEGYFNGMEDIYEYKPSPFNRVFGGCKYVFERREHSDEAIEKAIDAVWEKYHLMFEGHDKPTIEMYHSGGLGRIRPEGGLQSFSDYHWEYLSEH